MAVGLRLGPLSCVSRLVRSHHGDHQVGQGRCPRGRALRRPQGHRGQALRRGLREPQVRPRHRGWHRPLPSQGDEGDEQGQDQEAHEAEAVRQVRQRQPPYAHPVPGGHRPQEDRRRVCLEGLPHRRPQGGEEDLRGAVPEPEGRQVREEGHRRQVLLREAPLLSKEVSESSLRGRKDGLGLGTLVPKCLPCFWS